MSSEDKYISFSTKDQEQFITSDNSILKVKAELELIKDEKGNFIVKKVTIPDSFNKQKNLIYFYGKGTNWNKIIKRGSLIEYPNKSFEINDKNYNISLSIKRLDKSKGTIGISTHKLFSFAICKFALFNSNCEFKNNAEKLRVSFNLKEYALKCGYDVEKRNVKNSNEEKKESIRIKNIMDNIRKKVKKDLEILTNSNLKFIEKIKGQEKQFDSLNLLGRGCVSSGYINIEFTLSMAEYLVKLPLTQFPVSILKIDERDPNSYNMGLKFFEHFSMYGNHKKGIAQFIRISSLLKTTNLPDINDKSVKKHGWEDRIKKPFEETLNKLKNYNILNTWYYSKQKNVRLNTQEIKKLNYEEWRNIIIHYELNNPPNIALSEK